MEKPFYWVSMLLFTLNQLSQSLSSANT